MRQNVSTVIEHTTKLVLEERATQEGLTLSRYIRKVLEQHEKQPYARPLTKDETLTQIEDAFGE